MKSSRGIDPKVQLVAQLPEGSLCAQDHIGHHPGTRPGEYIADVMMGLHGRANLALGLFAPPGQYLLELVQHDERLAPVRRRQPLDAAQDVGKHAAPGCRGPPDPAPCRQ